MGGLGDGKKWGREVKCVNTPGQGVFTRVNTCRRGGVNAVRVNGA